MQDNFISITMVATDPRMRAVVPPPPGAVAPGVGGVPPPPPPKASILFGGQDAMEEDEAIPQAPFSSFTNAGGAMDGNNVNQSRWMASSGSQLTQGGVDLIQTIITPSPYPHHLTGPTSSRFRNAMGRITTRPTSDVEAWQALITEVNTCYRSLPNKHGLDADTQNKLDWMESCYGTLLKYFPYSSSHYVTIVEMLLAQSARVGEDDGPVNEYGYGGGVLDGAPSQRAMICQAKVERIFERVLGIQMDGSPSTIHTSSLPSVDIIEESISAEPSMKADGETGAGDAEMKDRTETSGDETIASTLATSTSVISGMCNSSVELWLLYVRARSREASRQAATMAPVDGAQLIREWTMDAYELAISQAAFVVNNHMLWKQYLAYVKSWSITTTGVSGTTTDHALAQKQMLQLRSIYQRLVVHPMTGLDQLWQEYEAFERAQSEALAAALISEYSPKYQHARTVYLERNRVYSMVDLQLDSKFATPPVDPHEEGEDIKDQQEDIAAKMQEEHMFLTLWKKRISYERTNPERLSPAALTQRVRQAFKEMACVLTLHPEVWHMWSTWELYLGGGSAPAAVSSSSAQEDASSTRESHKAYRSMTVLGLGLVHIPDCTLLAYEQAKVVELYTSDPKLCLKVLEKFLESTPHTLGFVLYQQMVRRYKGIAPARAVFAKARRVLLEDDRRSGGIYGNKDSDVHHPGDGAAEGTKEDPDADAGGGASKDTSGAETEENGKRWMVTNRLDPSVGTKNGSIATSNTTPIASTSQNDANASETMDQRTTSADESRTKPGPITWHLYASHATLEHRLNHSPEIAARVYELGLRKHLSFLTKPPYVMRYAQLLLELGDTVNLRALLTRAVSACEAVAAKSAANQESGTSKSQQQLATNSPAVAALWDMTLRFESLLSGSDPANISSMEAVEKRRRAALLGPDIEDVATGGFVGQSGDAVSIGAQKSTIAEQLIRSDGYDVSSMIVNGMSRTVDVLEVMGLWGNGGTSGSSSGASSMANPGLSNRLRMHQLLLPKTSASSGEQDDDDMPGGKSDASFQRRQLFQSLLATGVSSETDIGDGGAKGLLSARERLQQGGAGGAGGVSGGATGLQNQTNTAIAMAIQQSPEWLRPLLFLLPASKLRTIVLMKPPPHLTEMALTSLRQNNLPAERPEGSGEGSSSTLSGNKHRLDNDNDSSDEENGGAGGSGGGYATQFRTRRARQMMSEGQQNGLTDPSS